MATIDSNWDVIILGAGAAGLMCAAVASQRGRRVLVLERNAQVGRKILISGGGRCNFTNTGASHEQYVSGNTHFARSALSRYLPHDFLALVKQYGVSYFEKKLGQLFCDKSAREIVNLLLEECARGGATVLCQAEVTSVLGTGPFEVNTNHGALQCDSLVLATGGLSIPKIGATDFGYRIARQYGLKVSELRPALVPLTLSAESFPAFRELAGTSLDAEVSHGKTSFRENILFTHWGLSGPAILQISLYWNPGESIAINLIPELDVASWLLQVKEHDGKATLPAVLKRQLPARFVDAFLLHVWPHEGRILGEMSDKALRELGELLSHWELFPSGTQGYKKAEVTRGGVNVEGLSQKTMEAKAVAGLYFIGEVVDVTGWLGGYNFQWAWASGSAAGLSA